MAEEKECCCSHKTKERSEKEYKDMIHRLNRIEGQIRSTALTRYFSPIISRPA